MRTLARLYGVQTAYRDIDGRLVTSPTESVLAAISSLGAEPIRMADVEVAVAHRRRELAGRLVPPVTVAEPGRPGGVRCLLPATATGQLTLDVQLESGGAWGFRFDVETLRRCHYAGVNGAGILHRVPLPRQLPLGYHEIAIRVGDRRGGGVLIVAPRRIDPNIAPSWGAFLPLYAARRRGSLGVGDFTSLEHLRRHAGAHGAGIVATLPLLATFLQTPFEPSPYLPVSKYYWNELFVDAARLAHEMGFPGAADWDRLASGGHGACLDLAAAYRAKRRALEALAAWARDRRSGLAGEAAAYAGDHPDVGRYAAFRAAVEAGDSPDTLPAELLAQPGRPAADFHVFAQWAAARQLRQLAASQGPGLYLDLPLGVHPRGYDMWQHSDLFAPAATTGAPPDDFFEGGQNWGFRPPNPLRMRETGYAYWRRALAHSMGPATLLRIDHVMSLHRLYWIPDGFPADAGVYVRYPAEEMYAVLTLEAVREGASVVGEDLGTVPDEVRHGMARHGLLRMWVGEFELAPDRDPPMSRPGPDAVAAIDTHDTPTFAAFWQGRDIVARERQGDLTPDESRLERQGRRRARRAVERVLASAGYLRPHSRGSADVLAAWLAWLAGSDAPLVLVNLEDLWLERRPQNVPGTDSARPNWCRPALIAVEDAFDLPMARQAVAGLAVPRVPPSPRADPPPVASATDADPSPVASATESDRSSGAPATGVDSSSVAPVTNADADGRPVA